MDFNTLKKNSKDLESLQKRVEEMQKPAYGDQDENFWQPVVDNAGNGYAVIRFLPTPPEDGEDGLPFVRYWRHGFQGPTGQWYIENSRTTLNKPDPVSDYNSILWNRGDEELARKQKRNLHYVSNILVVEDPKNPENEGKVFYYRYGKKIFEKINEAMHPEFEDEEGYNPFDLWDGANFKLKIRKYEGYRNYDKAEFAARSAVGEDDADRERIWKQERTLAKFVAEDQFKSYEELQAKLEKVLGIDLDSIKAEAAGSSNKPKVAKPKPRTIEDEVEDQTEVEDDMSGDDMLALFEDQMKDSE